MKLVLLDRDGVINQDLPDSVKSCSEFTLLSGVSEAIRCLNQAGFFVAIVTNQAVVGRGDLTEAGLGDIHLYMRDLLKREGAHIDHIFACTSADPADFRRKPNPGLVLEALEKFNTLASETVLIGDALRDLEAATAAQCACILVRTGKGQETLLQGLPIHITPLTIADSLLEAVAYLKASHLS